MFNSLREQARRAVENIANRASSAALETYSRTVNAMRYLIEDIKEIVGGTTATEDIYIEEVEAEVEAQIAAQTEQTLTEVNDAYEEAEQVFQDFPTDEDADIDFDEEELDQWQEFMNLGFDYWQANELINRGVLLYTNGEPGGTRRRALSFPGDVLNYVNDIPAGYVEGITYESGFFYVYVA